MTDEWTTIACEDCKTPLAVPANCVIDMRVRFIRSHSDARYIGLDYDPFPVLTRVGQQIKIDGAVAHDCGRLGGFL